MWSGLDFDLSHDRVANDSGDESREAVPGRHGAGIVERLISELEGETGQFGALDLALTPGCAYGLHPSLVGPSTNCVGAHAKKLSRLSEPKPVHAAKNTKKA